MFELFRCVDDEFINYYVRDYWMARSGHEHEVNFMLIHCSKVKTRDC